MHPSPWTKDLVIVPQCTAKQLRSLTAALWLPALHSLTAALSQQIVNKSQGAVFDLETPTGMFLVLGIKLCQSNGEVWGSFSGVCMYLQVPT